MAYYIDEAKKAAVKMEGKLAFGWNAETRRFDIPIAEVSPKSRMRRCSDFEARCYLFENDPSNCFERIRSLAIRFEDEISFEDDFSDITLESAEANLRAMEEKSRALKPELTALEKKVVEYGMSMSEPGKCLDACNLLLSKDIEIARLNIALARLKAQQTESH